jgi:hypothetical protein
MGKKEETSVSTNYSRLEDDSVLESQPSNGSTVGLVDPYKNMAFLPGNFNSINCVTRKQAFYYAGWLANISYSFAVSSMFASLSAEKYNDSWGYWYGASSLLMNFPMSILFAYQASEKFQQMFQNRLTCGAAMGGLCLALATTLAGIAIARDTVSDSKNPWIRSSGGLGVTLFSFNTFSTRWVAATALIEGVLKKCMRKQKQNPNRLQKALALFLSDSKRLPENYVIGSKCKGNELGYESQLSQVYRSIPPLDANEELMSRVGSQYGGKRLLSVTLTYLALQTLPMWLDKAEQGGVALARLMGLKPDSFSSFNALGMASSVLFYLLSAWTFVDAVANFYLYVHYKSSRTSQYTTVAKNSVLIGSLLTLFALAWASGEGMKNEGLKSLSETGFSNNTQAYIDSDFGQVVTPEFWQSTWFMLFNLIAGVVVNGRSAVNFVLQMSELRRPQSSAERLVRQISSNCREDVETDLENLRAPMARELLADFIEREHNKLYGLNASQSDGNDVADSQMDCEEVKTTGFDVA